MQYKKRLLTTVILLVILSTFFISAHAEEPVFNSISLHFDVPDIPTLTECDLTISVYDGYDAAWLATGVHKLKRGERGFDMEFSVPQYNIGKKFIVSLIDGAKAITLDGELGNGFILETYSYPAEDGSSLKYQTKFYLGVNPYYNREAVIKVDGVNKTFYAHCFMGEELYVTTDLLSALGIEYSYDAANARMTLSAGGGAYTYTCYAGNVYAVRGSEAYNLNYAPFLLNDFCYVPLYDVSVYFACSYTVTEDTQYRRVITLKPTPYRTSKTYAEKYINGRGIGSKTNYLIWVSKSNYTVTAFSGSAGNWREVASFPCAIGASSSPTVEGSFEYYQQQSRWTYDKFYCGPIMRFYKGYALHSTLIRYNGTPYDNRVGVKISHGCVRIRPEGINWLVQNIPLYSRVLVTD